MLIVFFFLSKHIEMFGKKKLKNTNKTEEKKEKKMVL
jgi:hypothetical protein